MEYVIIYNIVIYKEYVFICYIHYIKGGHEFEKSRKGYRESLEGGK